MQMGSEFYQGTADDLLGTLLVHSKKAESLEYMTSLKRVLRMEPMAAESFFPAVSHTLDNANVTNNL